MEYNIGMIDDIIILLYDNVFFLLGMLNVKIFNVIRKYLKKFLNFYMFVFICLILLFFFLWNNLLEIKN